MSPVLTIFFLVAITTVLGVKTYVKGQPGYDEPPRSSRFDHRSTFIDSDNQLLSTEVPNSVDATLGSGNDDKKRMLAKKRDPPSLRTDIQDSSDGDPLRRHMTLVIAIPSVRPDRRKAIRETWSKWIDDRVILRFFTELPNTVEDGKSAENVTALLEEEIMTHGDVVVQDIEPGMNFGLKLLSAMRWMSYHFTFDFFLRLDDDYFLCLERLLRDLDCLLSQEEQHSPIFAGYRVCHQTRNVKYVDEAYLLFSSTIIDRLLATSDLKCSSKGSHTAAAWMRIGGPGNLNGDVAVVHDNRLDQYGRWWRRVSAANDTHSEYSPICEQGMGTHRIYPEAMKKIWIEESGRIYVTDSTDYCQSLFPYENDGVCTSLSHSPEDVFLKNDNFQPCDSFSLKKNQMWCGRQGC